MVQWLGQSSSKDTALAESNGKLLQVILAKETRTMKENNKDKVMGLGGETPKLDKSRMRIGEEPDAGGSITLADEGRMPDCAEMKKNRNTWLKKKTQIMNLEC